MKTLMFAILMALVATQAFSNEFVADASERRRELKEQKELDRKKDAPQSKTCPRHKKPESNNDDKFRKDRHD